MKRILTLSLFIISFSLCQGQEFELNRYNDNQHKIIRVDSSEMIYFLDGMQITCKKASDFLNQKPQVRYTLAIYEKQLVFGDSILIQDKQRSKNKIVLITTEKLKL